MKNLTSFSELFQNRIFRIPDYQRGYAWQVEQLTDFWEDIMNLSNGHYHYTGMISLKELTSDDIKSWDDDDKWIVEHKKYRAFHVVDGQQRITTFVILLKCIIDLANKNNIEYLLEDSISGLIAKYLYEENKNQVLRAYKFGYERDNPSFEYLKFHILENNSPKSLEKTFYTYNLSFAKAFFDEKLNELKKTGFDLVENLFLKLTTDFHFNIYEIESGFDVNVAFETMNNRGKKLSNLEILKNRLIYLVAIYEDKILSEPEKNKIRKKINDSWKEIYKQLGRNPEDPLNDDEYLRNHWIMYFKYSRRKGDDYIRFLLQEHFTVRAVQGKEREIRYVEDNPDSEVGGIVDVFQDNSVLHYKEIEQYADSLSELSQYWFYSYHPEYAKDAGYTESEIKWLMRLNRVGIANFRPLVCASLQNKEIKSEERVALFTIIEKCLFVWFRMAAFNNSLYSVDTYNYSRGLLNKNNVPDIIAFYEEKFNEYYASAKSAFITRIKNFFVKDGYFDWQDLRYFLYEYEDHLYIKSKHKEVNPAEWRSAVKGFYSIEHIYPQNPSDWYWENQFRDYLPEERSICVKTIGNLLLLSKDVNSSLQNYSYPRKCKPINDERTGYANGSFSEREVNDTYESWNPNNIYDRGKKLLHFFKVRWGIDFTSTEKEALLGMHFIQKERETSAEHFNHNIFTETLQDSFQQKCFHVVVKRNYIQIMKPNWIFDGNVSGSIHFEVFLDGKHAFDDLLGKSVQLLMTLHTEAGCPESIRKALKSLRKEIGNQYIAKDFLNRESYMESLNSSIQKIDELFMKYSQIIDDAIESNDTK